MWEKGDFFGNKVRFDLFVLSIMMFVIIFKELFENILYLKVMSLVFLSFKCLFVGDGKVRVL